MSKRIHLADHQKSSPALSRARPLRTSSETAVSHPLHTLQRALQAPQALASAEVGPLQRALGNQMLGRLTIQRRMTLGPVGDKYEQEADVVAKQVVGRLRTPQAAPSPVDTAQRQEEEEEVQMKPASAISSLQRQEEEEELQAKGDAMLSGGELSGEVETAVTSAKSGGRPLDDTIRAPMEQAFQADFSGVKIHTGGQADSLNRSLSARAFTSGQDVFFRSGEYNPGSTGGQELLAHELTHTIQQGSAVQRRIQRYTKIPVAEQAVNYWQGLNADLRVSDDGNMAVKHIDGAPSNTTAYQEFYATPAILQHSANALQQIDSAFTIAQGGATLVGTKPNSKWDKWRKNYKTLYKADISNQDLARTGRGDHSFNACSANTSNFLGVLRSEPGDPNRLEQRRNIILKLEGAIDHANKQINVGEDIGAALVEARKIVTGENTSGEAKTAYNEMWEAMRGWISWRYGVNESAVPDVGEAWAIMQGGTGGRSGMGHFAPVVAKSGSDSVTLENDVSQTAGQVRAQIGDLNPNWYMRMFGPVKRHLFSANEDQTFWGEAKKHESADYGDRPLVGRLGSA